MASMKIFFVSCFILLFEFVGLFGRELECSYSTWSDTLWPSHHRCQLGSVDLSAAHSSESFEFSGTSTQKSQTTTVFFSRGSSSIEFIPKATFEEFPNLNGLIFTSYIFPVLRNNIFTQEYKVLEYLYLGSNNIQSIEPEAFQHLNKLKWIRLSSNQIQSLPFQLFKKNPDLIYINFQSNKIASINPNFFDGLNKLKFLWFTSNQCISKNIGCETCSVSQDTLNSELNTCYLSFFGSSIISLNQSIVSTKVDLLGHLTTKTLEMQTSLAQSNKATLDSEFNALSTNLATKTQENFQETKKVLTQIENQLKENSEIFKEEIGKQSLSFVSVSTSIKNEFESVIVKAEENINATMKEATEKTEAILNETKEAVAGVEPAVSVAVEKLAAEVKEAKESQLKSNQELVELNKKTFDEATKNMERVNEEAKKDNRETIEILREIVLEETDNKLERHLQKVDVKVDQVVRMLSAELENEKLKAENKELKSEKEKETMNSRIKILEQENEALKNEVGKLSESKKQMEELLKRMEELESKFNAGA